MMMEFFSSEPGTDTILVVKDEYRRHFYEWVSLWVICCDIEYGIRPSKMITCKRYQERFPHHYRPW